MLSVQVLSLQALLVRLMKEAVLVAQRPEVQWLVEIRNMSIADLKHQELPLARIKKIMKLDEDVKVSSLMLKLIWCPLLMNIHPDDLR